MCAPELEQALRFWINTQFKHYSTEVTQLLSKGTIDKSSRTFNLNPELDDNNLLCLKGRLQFSSNDMRAKHPCLLPSNDKFVELLICDSHTIMCHLGVDATLTHLREQFWIVKSRHFV
ncbi:uncharacterized protein LOC118179458 [Stegodyphus dumicola]|uniref:uncharacterized protein LOC118179458 n=1 Tax=Stegodyphus dumicola TaxID=202533 RepID=UPI0015AA8CDC|nr:uncharacterized protein LOC118179458 [Stegodyphus dumicola]